MPTLGAPVYFLASAVAAVAVVALHLLAWRRPRPAVLPTARFAPAQAARAASRELQLQDLVLLALRVLALLLAGLALSAPAITLPRTGTARVIVADASRRVAQMQEVRDSVRVAVAGAQEVALVRVDSVARLVPDTAIGERADVRGVLAAGLVAAVREARRLAVRAQSVEIVVISPFARESWDSAAVIVRAAWSGEVRVMRVTSAGPSSPGAPAAADAASNPSPGGASAGGASLPPARDPVGAAFALAAGTSPAALRVGHAPPSAPDSAWMRTGGTLVWWPADRAAASDDSAGQRRAALLAWEGDAAIGRFAATGAALPPGGVIVRWGDGTPAASESRVGRGCLRTVAVSLPDEGDEAIRPAVVRLARWLSRPCGWADAALVDDVELQQWRRGQALPALAALPVQAAPPATWLVRALLLLTAALLALEWWWRARSGAPHAARDAGRVPPPNAREAA